MVVSGVFSSCETLETKEVFSRASRWWRQACQSAEEDGCDEGADQQRAEQRHPAGGGAGAGGAVGGDGEVGEAGDGHGGKRCGAGADLEVGGLVEEDAVAVEEGVPLAGRGNGREVAEEAAVERDHLDLDAVAQFPAGRGEPAEEVELVVGVPAAPAAAAGRGRRHRRRLAGRIGGGRGLLGELAQLAPLGEDAARRLRRRDVLRRRLPPAPLGGEEGEVAADEGRLLVARRPLRVGEEEAAAALPGEDVAHQGVFPLPALEPLRRVVLGQGAQRLQQAVLHLGHRQVDVAGDGPGAVGGGTSAARGEASLLPLQQAQGADPEEEGRHQEQEPGEDDQLRFAHGGNPAHYARALRPGRRLCGQTIFRLNKMLNK